MYNKITGNNSGVRRNQINLGGTKWLNLQSAAMQRLITG